MWPVPLWPPPLVTVKVWFWGNAAVPILKQAVAELPTDPALVLAAAAAGQILWVAALAVGGGDELLGRCRVR